MAEKRKPGSLRIGARMTELAVAEIASGLIAGKRVSELAKGLGLKYSDVYRVMRRLEKAGAVPPKLRLRAVSDSVEGFLKKEGK